MGAGCTKEPEVRDEKRYAKQVNELKVQLKLKIAEYEKKKSSFENELDKCQKEVESQLKNGNKDEAKRVLIKKQHNEKMKKKLNTQIMILESQQMVLDDVDINKDISKTLQDVSYKVQKVTGNIELAELEQIAEGIEDIKIKNGAIDSIVDGQMAKANIQDPNVSEELERIANQINGNFPKAYNGNLENNQQSNKEPAGNLVFL